jgi:Ca2+-binding EF-hand superfamily protein
MTNKILRFYSCEFDKVDIQHKNKLEPSEFLILYRLIENDQTRTLDEAKVIFRGIDFKDTGFVTKDAFLDLVKGLKSKNKDYLFKLIFRSFDVDRTRTLNPDEIVEYTKFCGNPLTRNEVVAAIERYGTKKINYAQLYNILTDEIIDPDTDPYDGQLRSKTCLIL